MQLLTYLALGDSYTIGEQVPVFESFPYQLIQILRRQFPDIRFAAPEIVAKTGWTTDELSEGITASSLLPQYNVVSLLIGVNNQYRGRTVERYQTEFEALLKTAIHFAGNDSSRVFVVSIPDWGVTPFASGRDVTAIAAAIDAYNNACRKITESYNCTYLDITQSQRIDGANDEYPAGDRLHPSGKEYAKWAEKLAKAVAATL